VNLHPPKTSSISDRWAGWRCRQRHGREQIEPGSRPATLMSSSTCMKKVILWVAATVISSQTLYFSLCGQLAIKMLIIVPAIFRAPPAAP